MAQAWTRIPELRAAGKHFQRAGRVPSSSAASEGGREGRGGERDERGGVKKGEGGGHGRAASMERQVRRGSLIN